MNLLAIAVAMVLTGTSRAQAINVISDEVKSAIHKQMREANQLDKPVKEAELKLVRAQNAKADPGTIHALQLALEREKDKQSAARTIAIHMTILAYKLEPSAPSGTSVMPGTAGRTIFWTPVAREREARQLQDSKGNLDGKLQPKKDLDGAAYFDGVTYIYPSAFEHGPGYLASILVHERTHFEQYTTKGKGDVMSYAEAQEEAYAAQARKNLDFFDPANPKELRQMQDIDRARDDEKAAADLVRSERKSLKGRLRAMLPGRGPSDMFESKVHTNVELVDIKNLVAKARAQAEIGHRETLKREAAAKEAAEKTAQRDHDSRLRDSIIDMTRRSCDNPGSVTQAELTALPRPYQKPSDFRWMAPLEPRDFPGREHCVNIYEYLAYSGRNAEELRKASTPAQMPAPIIAVPVAPTSPAPSGEATKIPFSRALPDFKSYAVSACSAPQQTQGDIMLFRAYDHSARTFDDALIGDLKNGMNNCSRQLFDHLIAANRRNDLDALSAEAIQAKVRALTPAPPVGGGGGGYSPPRNNEPGCEYDPNIGGTICPRSR